MSDDFEVGAPLPKSIGRCADLLAEVREVRYAMDKEVAAVKARENEIENHIIQVLSSSEDTGASGLRYRAQITKKTVPNLKDWGVFCAWVRKHDRFDLLQKRLATKAVEDLWQDRPDIPGIERFHATKLSLKKV